MLNFEKLLISKNDTIVKALNVIDSGSCKTAFVVDTDNKLLGSVADGDIRRALINGCELSDTIEHCIFNRPIVVSSVVSDIKVKTIMQDYYLGAIPVVENGIVIDIIRFTDLLDTGVKNIPIIIMAGGLGKRLGNLVSDIPKPMLKLAGEPILHHIINNLKKCGFSNIYISVNYKSDVIESFFGNGDSYGCTINYIKEPKKLGTGGSIRLCEGISNTPFIVVNGDVLTNTNIKKMLDFHIVNGFDMTIGTVKHDVNIDYGVLDIENNIVKKMIEKPVINYMINAGIYCFNADVASLIPKNEYFDIIELINKNIKVGSYEIKDYWIDIGHLKQLELAQEEYKEFI